MNSKEIKKYVEDQISYHCNEFGLVREEVTEVVLLNCIDFFYNNLLPKEDLIKCADYLGYEIDIELIEKEKDVRLKRKAQRKNKRKGN